MNPQNAYYDGVNTLLAPVRAAKSLMETALIIVLLLGAGLLYPLIQLVDDGHVTFGGFVVSFLTALFIFTLFYAPWYTVIGGITCFVALYICFCFDATTNLLNSGDIGGLIITLGVPGFLLVGILQKYIRWNIHYGTGPWELWKANIRYINSKCLECGAGFNSPASPRLGDGFFCSNCCAKIDAEFHQKCVEDGVAWRASQIAA